MSTNENDDNFEIFRDCLAIPAIAKLSVTNQTCARKRPGRKQKNSRKDASSETTHTETEVNDVADLSEFIDYLAEEIFSTLPEDLKSISYTTVQDDKALAERYKLPLDTIVQSSLVESLPPSVSDSLCSYGLIEERSDLDRFLEPVLNNYLTAAVAPPPEYTPSLTSSRPPGCEICGREHLPLTYHHLIPRQAHVKAVKRGWHKEWELNKVAWLCRACHSFVHKCVSNDELAKEYYDVDLLMQRDDVRGFAAWVGKVRWKAR